ncbi:MAG: tRNA (N6-threonylcarbamoyladenosine(37)-N6)-methyltransferase TrmO [Thermosphaera sp.]
MGFAKIELTPIGVVHVDASDEEVRESVNGVDGVVEVYQEYEQALKGLEGVSHLILVTYLHKVSEQDRKVLLVKPRRLVKYGIPPENLPLIGVFATDSPVRPNPIGISIVELKRVLGRFLEVRGLDVFNGTPVLDIKPYTAGRIVQNPVLPNWYSELLKMVEKTAPGVREL